MFREQLSNVAEVAVTGPADPQPLATHDQLDAAVVPEWLGVRGAGQNVEYGP